MASLKSGLLASAIAQNYSAYNQLLSLSSPSDSIAFWDDVVLTASNEHQKAVYGRRIAELAEEKQIPGWVRYVFKARRRVYRSNGQKSEDLKENLLLRIWIKETRDGI